MTSGGPPVEEDCGELARRLWGMIERCSDGLHNADCGGPTDHIAAEFARIRAEAVAAERGAVVAIIQAVEDEVPDGYDVVNLVSVMIERIRARGPAPAQQEETHEKD